MMNDMMMNNNMSEDHSMHGMNMDDGAGNTNLADNSSTSSHSGMMKMDGHLMPANGSIAGMMMQMTFYAGVNCVVLIDQWKTTNVGELFGTALFWFTVALLHQGTKRIRRSLLSRLKACTTPGGFAKLSDQDNGSAAHSPEVAVVQAPDRWCRVKFHALQSLLQVVQTTTSFLLMLVFMTYNVWLAVAIVLGDMCGYIIFCYDSPDISGGCG